jgi:hypothetical protein
VDREQVESFVRQLKANNFQVYVDRNDVTELRPPSLQLAQALDALPTCCCACPGVLAEPAHQRRWGDE